MSKCIGCGVTLQNNHPDDPGYVKDLSFKYCERCFRNVNYSEMKDEELLLNNSDIINKINENSDITFFVVDFLNISEQVMNLYRQINTDKYIVVNKMDVIPKDIKDSKISRLLKDVYHIEDKIIYTSNKNNNLESYFTKKNIFFCGISNSGKTSLISKITGNNEITKSNMINTTQDYLKINFNNYKIIDCPGFIIKTNKIDSKYLKLVNPTKLLKIRNYNLKPKTSLNIHNLLKFSFIDTNNVSCYFSNGLIIKKDYKELESFEQINVNEDSDLLIIGYGFLNVKEQGKINIPIGLVYEVRKSIFKE